MCVLRCVATLLLCDVICSSYPSSQARGDVRPWLLQITVFNTVPPLTSVAGSLATFSSGMPVTTPLDNLETVLITGETTLNAAPYTTAGGTFTAWLTNLK